MNKELLINELNKLNINLSTNQIKQIDEFCKFLLAENKKYNLTAIKTYEEILLKHVYDSLTIVQAIDLKEGKSLLDIGSGAGFPGIILKIVFPHLQVTLLDSNHKKTNFLELVKKQLKLNNLEIINKRAEDYIKNKRETYDLVTARAVANLNILIELAIPFLKINGLFIAMKGNIEEEIKSSNDVCPLLNCNIQKIIKFTLPIENSNRSLIIIEKLEKTKKEYPRAYSTIMKKPLKKSGK